ncbi:MAG: hypothetical protein HFE90_03150 [Firmicutes bacterium]|nr:hypothetical protein [Bacillota bacterium]
MRISGENSYSYIGSREKAGSAPKGAGSFAELLESAKTESKNKIEVQEVDEMGLPIDIDHVEYTDDSVVVPEYNGEVIDPERLKAIDELVNYFMHEPSSPSEGSIIEGSLTGTQKDSLREKYDFDNMQPDSLDYFLFAKELYDMGVINHVPVLGKENGSGGSGIIDIFRDYVDSMKGKYHELIKLEKKDLTSKDHYFLRSYEIKQDLLSIFEDICPEKF